MRTLPVIVAGALLALGVPLLPAEAQAPSPAPMVLADAAGAPAGESLPQLPTVEVAPRPVHTVPGYEPPPSAPVIFDDRGAGTTVPQLSERRAPPPMPVQRSTRTVSGAAQLGELLSLSVGGHSVPLFGVRLPAIGDRCSAERNGAPRACTEMARAALATRLAAGGTVSCRIPPGQRDHRAAAICLDSRGVDLGGFLVGAGLALADRTQSYDYVGAEGVARSLRHGLWRFR
jgi:endonuclease YncB( thermonuclease family)